MTEISNVRVYDLKESIIASGYPMQTDIGDEDFDEALKRAIRLAKQPSNSGHGNFLTGIRVSYDIKYPQYLSPQLQRYHFNDIVSSQSKMHRLAKLDIESSCNEYVAQGVIDVVKVLQELYNYNPSYVNYMMLVSNCPLGLELTMRCSTNYMQLKTIYNQRKNHKLKEDWGAYIEFIQSLPYAKELIIND